MMFSAVFETSVFEIPSVSVSGDLSACCTDILAAIASLTASVASLTAKVDTIYARVDMPISGVAAAVISAASTTPIASDVKKMNGATVLGTGQSTDKWRG